MAAVKNIKNVTLDRRTLILNRIDGSVNLQPGAERKLVQIRGNGVVRRGNRAGIGKPVSARTLIASAVTGDCLLYTSRCV